LGTLDLFFKLCILVYLAYWVFYTEKHYLNFQVPDGVQRVVVQDPCMPITDADRCTRPPKEGKQGVGQLCKAPKAFRCDKHTYCKEANTPAGQVHAGVGGRLTCRYWDHNSIVWPPSEQGSLSVATRVNALHQSLKWVEQTPPKDPTHGMTPAEGTPTEGSHTFLNAQKYTPQVDMMEEDGDEDDDDDDQQRWNQQDYQEDNWEETDGARSYRRSGRTLLDDRHVSAEEEHKEESAMEKAPTCDDQLDMGCQFYPPHIMAVQEESYDGDAYIADIGNFTVRLAHVVQAKFKTGSNLRQDGGNMEGWLMRCIPGKDCTDDANWAKYKHLPKTGVSDKILLHDILWAVTPNSGVGAPTDKPGLDLDGTHDACPHKCHGKNATFRYMGFILQADINYDNTGTQIGESSQNEIKYHIKFTHLPRTKFSTQVVQRGSGHEALSHRNVNSLYGPRINFNVGGVLAQFDMQGCIIHLTTALGMLALAATIVDCACDALDRYYNTGYGAKKAEIVEDTVADDLHKEASKGCW